MALIVSSAYMCVCGCGRHVRFVLADGTVGPEIYSEEKAREELVKLHENKLITDLEFKFLKSQISDAPDLAHSDSGANPFTRLVCEIANTMPDCDMQEPGDNKYVM